MIRRSEMSTETQADQPRRALALGARGPDEKPERQRGTKGKMGDPKKRSKNV